MAEEKKKKKVDYASAWAEARKIVWSARWRLLIGSILLLISRLAGMVLPASTKYIGDEVFTNRNYGLIKWIALAIGISTLVQGVTSFVLSQILGVAAQRAITEMRKRVQAHIERLPIAFFDSTQSGQLISRINRQIGLHARGDRDNHRFADLRRRAPLRIQSAAADFSRTGGDKRTGYRAVG